mmetsp:Transcript_770/g.2198  ORF Transcript_770/g.2198 Transcript_770/m.2198 type:complete len:329 (+) Transcript_770:46-1032(+)
MMMESTTCLIAWVPNACRSEIFEYLDAVELVRVVLAWQDWADTAVEAAKQNALRRIRPEEAQLAGPSTSWLRVLRIWERLALRVGAPDPNRTWREEWPDLEQKRDRDVVPGKEPTPEQSLRYVRASADWKVVEGWPDNVAVGHTLIMTKFKQVLGNSIRDHSPRFAASCHLVAAALSFRASCEPVAPPAYNDLTGPYGLGRADDTWLAIVGAPLGFSFETTTPLEASASTKCLTARGFCAPVIDVKGNSTDVQYHPMVDSDIVCFESREPDGHGFHSLVRTAHTQHELQYDLPPLARVTLVRVDQPGRWSAFGLQPAKTLYSVHVSFL